MARILIVDDSPTETYKLREILEKHGHEVLEAATVVLKRCGPIEFTLSGVAKEVGLSRAALIQRFTNRDTLLVRMMERGVEQEPPRQRGTALEQERVTRP